MSAKFVALYVVWRTLWMSFAKY